MTKNCLIVLSALIILATHASIAYSASPQECKKALNETLKKIGITEGPFWKLSDETILKFKKQAKEKGLWDQFARICNAWSGPLAKQCKGCTCTRDFRDTACSPNCGCCWGDTLCPK